MIRILFSTELMLPNYLMLAVNKNCGFNSSSDTVSLGIICDGMNQYKECKKI